MRSFAWKLIPFTAFMICFTCAGLAQPPANTLMREGDTFRHEPSKSSFKLPAGWEIIDTKSATNQPSLAIRKPNEGVDVLITWSKLQDIKFEEAVEMEVSELAKTYGKEKVAKKDPITVENKSIAVIEIGDGPDRNGKQMGVVYLFDAGADARERWKVKIRGIINKTNQAEGMKAVAGILPQFQW